MPTFVSQKNFFTFILIQFDDKNVDFADKDNSGGCDSRSLRGHHADILPTDLLVGGRDAPPRPRLATSLIINMINHSRFYH